MKKRLYMNIYIAFLKGINVGRKNIIKMADLKQLFESMEFCEVQTYIQSGNVIFKSNEEEEYLCKKIEYGIKSAFGLSVPVILRTDVELEQIICNCPFTEGEISEARSSSKVECFYVSLLADIPSQVNIEKLNAHRNEDDEYRITGREIFILLRHGIRNSKLANNLGILGVPWTIRNWRTLNKLNALTKAMKV